MILRKSLVLSLCGYLILNSALVLAKKRNKRRSSSLSKALSTKAKPVEPAETVESKENKEIETKDDKETVSVPVDDSSKTEGDKPNIKLDELKDNLSETNNLLKDNLQGTENLLNSVKELTDLTNKKKEEETEEDLRKKKELEGKRKEIEAAKKILESKIEETKSSCTGIASKLKTIHGLAAGTTAMSAVGTLSAGGATAVGFVKDGVNDLKNNKAMKHTRTALLATSAGTSALSMGTAGGAAAMSSKVAAQMKTCNAKVKELVVQKNLVKTLIEDLKEYINQDDINRAERIISGCKSFSESQINSIKNSMIASSVISSIGTVAGTAGAVTSGLSDKKKKDLNLTSNIMAGITTGTSVTTAGVSGATQNKIKLIKQQAETCESSFN